MLLIWLRTRGVRIEPKGSHYYPIGWGPGCEGAIARTVLEVDRSKAASGLPGFVEILDIAPVNFMVRLIFKS